MAPVIAPARSEATTAAKLPTSASVGKHFSNVPVSARCASISSTVMPARSAKPLKTSRACDVASSFGNHIGPQANDADAVGAELTRQDAREVSTAPHVTP